MLSIKSFRKSTKKNKKYDAIMSDGSIVSFGHPLYQQYKDKALGLYSNKDHLDKKRKELYKARHHKDINKKFSPGWFSYTFLWSD
jgi:uncharacterized protein YlbG (UPF0298 family)